MKIQEAFSKIQKEQIAAEQKRYNEAVARAKKEGRDFDPLDDAPTGDPATSDPVQKAILDIWYGKKVNG